MKFPIEIPLLLLYFAFTITDSVTTNLIIFRTCYVTLGCDKSECALLGGGNTDNRTAILEKLVQPYADVINMVHTLTLAGSSLVTCVFVAPWSDRFGRKPLLMVPVTGFTVAYLTLALFSAFESISPWYWLVCSIPVCLTGGASSYLTAFLSYITDVTTDANRGTKMGKFEAFHAVGIFLGNISSSYALKATNYPSTFLISVFCCCATLFCTAFFVPESLADPETEGRFRSLFRLTNLADMVKTTFKKRRQCDRSVVLSCVLMSTFYVVVINGTGAVVFLFLREKFQWSLEKFTLCTAAFNVMCILGTVVGVYLLHKLLKIQETVILLVGFVSVLIGMFAMGIASTDWEVYVGAAFCSLAGFLSPMVKSLVSKAVPNEEIGKIFAVIVVSESLFGMAASPAYTAIYNSTINKNAGIFNFVSAGVYVLEIMLIGGVIMVRTINNIDGENEQLINDASEDQSRSVAQT